MALIRANILFLDFLKCDSDVSRDFFEGDQFQVEV